MVEENISMTGHRVLALISTKEKPSVVFPLQVLGLCCPYTLGHPSQISIGIDGNFDRKILVILAVNWREVIASFILTLALRQGQWSS